MTSTVDLGRITRTLDAMMAPMQRPLRAGEHKAVIATLKGQSEFLGSLSKVTGAAELPAFREASGHLTAAAAELDAAVGALASSELVHVRFRKDRLDATGVLPVLTRAREEVVRSAELIGSEPVNFGTGSKTRRIRPIEDLVPAELQHADDAKYVTDTRPDKVQSALRWVLNHGGSKLLGTHVSGAEHVPKEGGVIFVANHSFGAVDGVYVGQGHERTMRFMAADGFEKRKLASVLYPAGGATPIGRNYKRGMAIARAAIESGQSVVIYPERDTVRGSWLREPADGVTWLAHATGAPVVPVGVFGHKPAYTRGESALLRPMSEVSFGAPLRFEKGASGPDVFGSSREQIWQAVDAEHSAAQARYAQRRNA